MHHAHVLSCRMSAGRPMLGCGHHFLLGPLFLRRYANETEQPSLLRRFFRALNPFRPSEKGNSGSPTSFSLALGPIFERLILRSHVTRDTDLAHMASKTLAAISYGFIGVVAMGTIGIDTSPLIAGLGITGFTIGFALKEIATNFLSGILLMFERPFEKGSKLKIHGSGGGIEGIVMAIDIRYVHLKVEGTDSTVLVPSSIVYSNPLSVWRNVQHPSELISPKPIK